MSTNDIVSLLLAVAPYVVPEIVAFLVYSVKKAMGQLPASSQPLVQAAVKSGVAAAEQTASGYLNAPGKKQLAVELIEKQLAALHIRVPSSSSQP